MSLRDTPKFGSFGYWPNTPSQWREPSVDDCTWYAGEFAFQAADVKHRNYHPVNDIRTKSADNKGGTTVLYMTTFMYNWWPSDARLHAYYGSFGESRIIDMLGGGATFIVGGDYEKLPLHYRRWTNNDNFNHAVAIRFYDPDTERVAMYGGGPQRSEYDGEWIKLDALLNGYWWRGGNGWVAGVVGPYREEPIVKPFIDPEDATRELRVRARSFVYDGPSTLSPLNRRIWSDTKWWPVIGRAQGGWFLILWRDADDESVRFGYIHRDDVLEQRDVQRTGSSGELDPELMQQLELAKTEIQSLEASLEVARKTSEERLAVINTVRDVVRAR